jgi:hypothetical protein|tara:strand:+ start:103 stop:1407 length:1305 start_codon:yes stop_codon:yes gene_type:complete
MATESEVLLALNESLNDYETQVVKATSRVTEIRVITGDRDGARSEIQGILDKNRIKYGPAPASKSSFTGTQIQTPSGNVQLIYKKKGGAAGSGAGAALTKLTEASQCLYAAIAFGLKREITNADVTEENAEKFSSMYDTDEKLESMLNNLPDVWIQSCTLGANKLWKTFKGKGKFVFHRGSKTVDAIENNFKRIKKLEGIRMDLNKWSPADIYIVDKDFDITCLNEEKTILGLNQCMQERIENNTLIGVSLKKIMGSAKITLKNVFKDMKTTRKYDGYTFSDTSMDGYLNISGGTKIQFRSFGGPTSLTGWQGEVKGAQANQGKISLGPVNMILKNHGLETIPTDAARRVKSKDGKVNEEILKGYEKYSKMGRERALDTLMKAPQSWLYSKLQVTQLLDIIEGIRGDKRNQVIEDLYLYASSQSKYSAAYYKLE